MTQRSNRVSVLSALVAFAVSACGGAPPPAEPTAEPNPPAERVEEPPPPPPPAHVRVIHASPDPATASVDLYLDDATTAAVSALAFKSSTAYVDVPPGVHQVAARVAGSPVEGDDAALTAPTPELASSGSYTVIAHGLFGAEPALTIAAAPDSVEPPAEGKAHVRFFHALVGVDAVDICLPGATARAAATPVFVNVAYGAFGATPEGSPSAEVPAGAEIVLQVRAQHGTPCTGRVAGVVHVTPTAAANHTLVAVGRATGRPAVTKELLVCTDAPSTDAACTAVAIGAR